MDTNKVSAWGAKVGAAIASILKADAGLARAATSFVNKGAEMLSLITDAAAAYGPCTSAQFDAQLRKPLRQAMKDSKRYPEDSLKQTLAVHVKSFIAASHKIAALEGENEQAYAKRVLPELKQRKLFVAANAGGAKKGARKEKSKAVKVTREGALIKLVGTDAAKRQAVDYLVANCMDKLLALYASEVKADDVA